MNSEFDVLELASSNEGDIKQNGENPETFPIVTELIHYNDFFRQYLVTNTPCLIRENTLMHNWPSCSDWICSEEQRPNLNFFKTLINVCQHKVPVSNCGQKYFNSQEKCDMTFASFLDYWNENIDDRTSNLYLKDWHFVKEVPHYKAYRTPCYFSSDWLNEYLEGPEQETNLTQPFRSSDYKFVYIGPIGSWTPFHSDVFGSYSWSANIIGEKEWIFFPPGYEKFLIDKNNGEVLYDINKLLPCNDNRMFTRQSFLYEGHEIVYYRVRQKRNEIVFVPSEWYHQVTNIEGTISINHNWFNATNINTVWNILQNELKKVEAEISDCKPGCKEEQEWRDMCQSLLRNSHGMNIEDFINLCTFIAKRRIEILSNVDNIVEFDRYKFGVQHVIYDLNAIKKVLENVDRELIPNFDKDEIVNEIKLALSASLTS